MLGRRRLSTGFTIVELLIAVTITVLIVVLLGTMFGSLTNTASRANQRIDAFRDARAALQMMERDLSSLVRTQWSPDPFASPAPTATPQPITRAAAYFALDNRWQDPTNDPYSDPSNLYFSRQLYALISLKNSGPSDVCAVGYYCSWDKTTDPSSGAVTAQYYALHRFFRDSRGTYAALCSPSPTPTPSYVPASDLYKPSPSATPKDDVLAQYIWDLQVIVYDKSGSIISPQTTNGVTTTATPFICDGSLIDPTSPTGNPAPATIEISFNAISPEAARALIAVTINRSDACKVWMAKRDPGASPADREQYDRLIAPHTYEFRTRIKL